MAKPDKLDIVWAKNGVSVDPGDAKFELGWEAEIPPYQYFNYILNKHSEMLDHVNSNGIPIWDTNTTYVLGAKVLHNAVEYRCTNAGSQGQEPGVSGDWFDVDSDFDNRISTNGTDITANTDLISANINQPVKTTSDVLFNNVDINVALKVNTVDEKTPGAGVSIKSSTGENIKTAVFNIGVWAMSPSINRVISTSLPNGSILKAEAVIFNDSDFVSPGQTRRQFSEGGVLQFKNNSGDITLKVTSGGIFDGNEDYNGTTYSRGYVTVTYTV